jgi:hypothetical protein
LKPNLDWHFEFTQSNEKPNITFDEDDILVIFITETILEYNKVD